MIDVNKVFCVYKITNKENGKIYIGESGNVKQRWNSHLSTAKNIYQKNHKLIHRAINKYGKDYFSFEVIESYDNEIEALEREIYWIAILKTNVYRYGIDAGYNQTDGGEGTSGHKLSDETRKKMSENMVGENNSFFGKKHTEENKEQISKSKVGKNIGENNHFFGKTHSPEVIEASRGENNKKAKMTEKQVISMLNDYYTGNFTESDLTEKYPITRATVNQILQGENWKHIPRNIVKINEVKLANKAFNQKGINGPRAKLTEGQVLAIYNDPRKLFQIAVEYQVSDGTISAIKTGKTWSHLTGHIKKNK